MKQNKLHSIHWLNILLWTLFITPCFHLQAQSTTSKITGHVSDGEEAISEAVVTAVHLPTNTTFYAISNKKGNYVIYNVIAGGPYEIRIEKTGYQTAKREGLYAPVSEAVIANIEIRKSTVTLGEVAIYNTSDEKGDIQHSGAATHLSREEIESIPTASRSLNEVMKLTPQSAVMGSGLAVGGGNYRSSAITLDGATFNNVFGSGSNLPGGGSPISLDAIDQITINLTPFDVRNNGFTGSVINITTKRGTNQWHGSVYDYFTSNKFRGTHVGENELSNTSTLNNVTGLTLGGPIVKNKLFFFVNAEYTVDNVAGSSRQARNSESDTWGGSTSYNRPTTSEMDNISQYLQDTYGYDPGRYQNYTLKTPDYKLLARLDWNINTKHNFNIRFNHTHNYSSEAPSSSMSPLGGTNTTVNIGGTNYTFNRYSAGRESDYALYFESARYYQVQNFTSLAAELNSSLLDGKVSNMARITWSYQNEPRDYEGDLFPTVDILEPYTDASGNTQYALFTTFGVDPFTYENLKRVHTINATDEVSFSHGIHSFVAGAQFEFNRIINGYMQGGAGWYLYDSWDSFVSGANPLAFMITHANLDDPTATVYPTIDYSQASLYFQDAMNINRHFSLTAGLRLEMPFISFPYDNVNEDFLAVAEANPNSSFAGLSTGDLPQTTVNISPRLNFRWDATHDGNVVLRGGTGLFTGRIPNTWLINAVSNSNCLQFQYIANAQTGNAVIPFYADRTDIINALYANETFYQQDLAAPTATTILARNLTMPSSWKSALALEVKLPLGIKGLLEGIYSLNFNEVVATTLGYQFGDSIQLPGEPEQRVTYVSENITNRDGSRMSGYYLHNAKGLHGQYFALTVQLIKQFSWGLDLSAAYTHNYSQTVSDGGGDQVNNIAQVCNVNGDNAPELGYTSSSAPHRVIAYANCTIQSYSKTATKIGLTYEGYNTAYVNSSFNQARYSYTMTTDEGTSISAAQLIYIPTTEELASMPFISTENRDAYEAFISSDPYLSKHRGEYSKRNGAVTPWFNRINLNLKKELYFTQGERTTTLDVGLDINNIANLLYNEWGTYKKLSSENILNYSNGVYTFTEPTWSDFSNFASTWSILFHIRYVF